MDLSTLKKIRKARNIKQKNILNDKKGHSSYAKIENGNIVPKIDTLETILNSFDVSIEEFVHMANYEKSINKFKTIFRPACKNPKNKILKNILMTQYYPKKTLVEEMTKLELMYYVVLKNQFSGVWKDITKLTKKEISYIVKLFKNKSFYSQYDCSIILNSMSSMTENQMNILINSVFPIEDIYLRTNYFINTVFSILTNAITKNIYILDYRKAWEYIELAESFVDITTGYYTKIQLEYSKCIVQRFLEKDTFYIEKARKIISTLDVLGDDMTANAMTEELNNLTEKADYYLDKKRFKTVPLNE